MCHISIIQGVVRGLLPAKTSPPTGEGKACEESRDAATRWEGYRQLGGGAHSTTVMTEGPAKLSISALIKHPSFWKGYMFIS